MSVENTFGKLKGRFIRFSKSADMEISSIVVVITASCTLHNICQIQNNAFLPIWQKENEAFEEPVVLMLMMTLPRGMQQIVQPVFLFPNESLLPVFGTCTVKQRFIRG